MGLYLETVKYFHQVFLDKFLIWQFYQVPSDNTRQFGLLFSFVIDHWGASLQGNQPLALFSPKNATSILKYLIMGMSPPFAPLRSNKLCKLISVPLADPSLGLKIWSK